MVIRYSRDNLPSDPSTWPSYRKKRLTPLLRITGPFEVDTPHGVVRCDDGYLAQDARGELYCVAAEEKELIYEEPYLTPGEAASRLGVQPMTLRRWDDDGRLPHTERTPGGQRRYLESDVAALTSRGHQPGR